MQIVFVHYHLNPGGVTQVILNQLKALGALPSHERPQRVGVLYGGRHHLWPETIFDGEPPFEVEMLVVSALDYDDECVGSPEQLTDDVANALAASGFAATDTLLHIHNHSLGKNVSWPVSVSQLAQRGYRCLLQVHDFAEDFRPANYRRLSQARNASEPRELAIKIYPQAAAMHYATLTRGDYDILAAAGVLGERLHVLPNPVAEFAGLKDYDQIARPVRDQLGIPSDARLVLYPVRGLRRKNVGEMLLHAAISHENSWHAITLAPKNPQERPSFGRWQSLAEELQLRALFDVCGSNQTEFLDVMAGSDALITTSVAEGFGMVFLEAWLAGRPLIGRNLPSITREFEAAGIEFTGLRDTLEIPFAWLPDKSELADALGTAFQWACDQYGVAAASGDELASALEPILAEPSIDFALLPSRFQELVIRRAAADPASARQAIAAHNTGLEDQLAADRHELAEQIASNAEVVRSTYSLDAIGGRLRQVYATLERCPQASEFEPLPQGELILKNFLRVDRLHAIRFEE